MGSMEGSETMVCDNTNSMVTQVPDLVQELKAKLYSWIRDILKRSGLPVEVTDFSHSFGNGDVLLVLVKILCGQHMDLTEEDLEQQTRESKIKEALQLSESHLKVKPTLSPEEWIQLGPRPDATIVFKFISQLYLNTQKK